MPGATALSLGAANEDRLVVWATYGFVESVDAGKTWRWVCEQAIGVTGEADPPIGVMGDGSLVLVSPKGGLLVSRDRGCTWSTGSSLVTGKKTVDVAVDPGAPSRAVVIASTVAAIDDAGLVQYDNVVVETKDDAASWQSLAPLPRDFTAETIDIAPSDPLRLYASGTASNDALVGVVVRSTDGGQHWDRFTVGLPAGSGSVFIGAIDPVNPARVWIRVPARGDTFGFFPASLLVSEDGGEHFTVVATTKRAMFGFALSPDGSQVAYGGPYDGLFTGPAPSGPFAKVSGIGVRCLKWRQSGLYACASQPLDPFSLGLSAAADGVFTPLYDSAATCPAECPADAGFSTVCRAPWAAVSPAIKASPSCSVPWTVADASPSRDAASDAGSADADAGSDAMDARVDAEGAAGAPGVTHDTGVAHDAGGVTEGGPDASTQEPAESTRDSGCACRSGASSPPSPPWVFAVAMVAFGIRRRRRVSWISVSK